MHGNNINCCIRKSDFCKSVEGAELFYRGFNGVLSRLLIPTEKTKILVSGLTGDFSHTLQK